MKNSIVEKISTIVSKKGHVLKESNMAWQKGVRSKGVKFVPAADTIDRAKLKTELKEYRRKLRLLWPFRNDEQSFVTVRFRPKSSFNPRNQDVIIEKYLSC